jgi:hypothetical protein
MTKSDDRECFIPFPRPFPMHALQYITSSDISAKQKKAIAVLALNYFKNCGLEEVKLAEGLISELENLESRS